MNAISKALVEIKYRIPLEVLEIVVRDDNPNYVRRRWEEHAKSLDEKLLTQIIRPRVLVDCNLVGGDSIKVPLQGMAPTFHDDSNTVYYIPPELINNRNIVSVLGILYSSANSIYGGMLGHVNTTSMNSVTNVSQRIGDAASLVPVLGNTVAKIIANNTIALSDNYRIVSHYVLKVTVDNEENLNNIQPRSYIAFSNLCVLAVKSYIYNKLLVKLDKGYLDNGQELSSIKNIVESYADAEEMYRTYLTTTWQKIAYMNDTPKFSRFIRMLGSPGL